MRKQYLLNVSYTDTDPGIIEESPNRTRLLIQHIGDRDEPVTIYQERLKIAEGFRLYPYQWVQLDRDDDCHKQWFLTLVTGVALASVDVRVIEWFKDSDLPIGTPGIPQPVLPVRSGLWM